MEKVSKVNRSREWFDTPELYGWMRRAAAARSRILQPRGMFWSCGAELPC